MTQVLSHMRISCSLPFTHPVTCQHTLVSYLPRIAQLGCALLFLPGSWGSGALALPEAPLPGAMVTGPLQGLLLDPPSVKRLTRFRVCTSSLVHWKLLWGQTGHRKGKYLRLGLGKVGNIKLKVSSKYSPMSRLHQYMYLVSLYV